MDERTPLGPPWTLDAFRGEAAHWIGREADAFACVAWKHDPGSPLTECDLEEADALSVPRAEYAPETDDPAAAETPWWARTPDAPADGAEPCTLHEMKVVYVLTQKLLGWRGAVTASSSGKSWNVYREP